MTRIDRALASFEPVSLQHANELASLQTRVDRKYIVDENTLEQLLHELAPTMRVVEIDGARGCDYHSTYFDTDDLALYRAAVQGRRERYKVRSRSYGDAGPCFLEVKAKGPRGANVKSRIDYCRARRSGITPDGYDFVEQATGDHGLASELRPVMDTEYTRSTLIDPAARTRLTFDRHLRCNDGADSVAVFNGIVVETKSSRAPSAADEWLWRHQVRPTKLSKFCTGLATIRPELPGNKWHRVIHRHWDGPTTDALGVTPEHCAAR